MPTTNRMVISVSTAAQSTGRRIAMVEL
jgi:hypothetical protein